MKDTMRKWLVPTGILPTLACVALAAGLSIAHDHGGHEGHDGGSNSGSPSGGAPVRTWQDIQWQHDHWNDIQRAIAGGGAVADRIIASGATSLAWGPTAPAQRVARFSAPAQRHIAAPTAKSNPDEKALPAGHAKVPPLPGRQGSLALRTTVEPLNLLAFR